ncbi:MAG TPA: hypothetical protein PLZ84_03635, partial [Clostridia bacterium]|nr:hypothetical protein [Clostridia bacterium]
MYRQIKGLDSTKGLSDLNDQLYALWRTIEGDAKNPADWLANARLNIYTASNSENIVIDSTQKTIIEKGFETD